MPKKDGISKTLRKNPDHALVPIDKIMAILQAEVKAFKTPIVTEMVRIKRDPFKVLISTILSLRTKDETTRQACVRLFALADTPEKMTRISPQKIEALIYPVGFYKNKSRTIIAIAQRLVKEFQSTVPDEIDTLLTFNGVGRKTANLVITLGYNKPGICVDIHVHRISNRLGLVTTKNPDETEMILRRMLPKKYWLIINDILVAYGQNICRPISPFCSICKIKTYCQQKGIDKYR